MKLLCSFVNKLVTNMCMWEKNVIEYICDTFKLNMGLKEKSCYIGLSLVYTISPGHDFNLKVSHM